MRLFSVSEGNEFKEYQPQRFMDEHREQTMEDWLENNPGSMVENGGLFIIGRQVTTNLNTSIDLLGLDRAGNVAVVELKRDKTPRETLAQALEYTSFAATLTGDQLEMIYHQYLGDENITLAEGHKEYFNLSEEETISFNKNQRIVLVGAEITQPIRQSASYLRQIGLSVTCLEFSYFQTEGGEQLCTIDVVVGNEPLGGETISSASGHRTNEQEFLSGCTDGGRILFEPLLEMAKSEGLVISWGNRGFSIRVDYNGKPVSICYGYPDQTKPNQQLQSFWVAFPEIAKNIVNSETLVEEYREKFLAIPQFESAAKHLKYIVSGNPSKEQVEAIVGLVKSQAIDLKKMAEKEAHSA